MPRNICGGTDPEFYSDTSKFRSMGGDARSKAAGRLGRRQSWHAAGMAASSRTNGRVIAAASSMNCGGIYARGWTHRNASTSRAEATPMGELGTRPEATHSESGRRAAGSTMRSTKRLPRSPRDTLRFSSR